MTRARIRAVRRLAQRVTVVATALHAGYLRNIALGHALSSALEAAGAHVARQTQIADAGRDMAAAMAAYLTHADGRDPEQAKSSPVAPEDRTAETAGAKSE